METKPKLGVLTYDALYDQKYVDILITYHFYLVLLQGFCPPPLTLYVYYEEIF